MESNLKFATFEINSIFFYFQVPGTIISIYANRLLGRKITLISANCVTGLSCLLIIIVPQSGIAHLTLGCIGLWGMSISFATVYLYAGELFPTVVRNSGVGLSSTVARIGSMVAPFVATLAHTSAWLPPLAFGIVPLIGAGLCIILPDTRGKKLPDTLEEGEVWAATSWSKLKVFVSLMSRITVLYAVMYECHGWT